MARLDKGFCEHCHREFHYQLWHAEFSDFSYVYCDSCGSVATLSYWEHDQLHLPEITVFYQEINQELEPLLRPCACGGRFKKGALPRCPHCKSVISAGYAASYIEANSPDAAKGWRWQRSWSGLYCMGIEDPAKPDCISCAINPYLDLDLYRRKRNSSK
jgi:hypothetical protein